MGLKLNGIGKTVGKEIHLKDINLEFESGSRYVVLGRTLAGKTSLLRIMAGLDRPTTGTVEANGVDVTGVSVRKRSVAMVYQQFINYPSQTIYENIASPPAIHGLPKQEIRTRVMQAATMLHIENMLDRLPAELSGGQQQRTAIARAPVKDVDLLLLDEPPVNLDYKLREELRDELRKIFKARDSVVVYTTTEPTEALMLGGNVIVMHEGEVLQVGPTAEVFLHPVNTRVAEVFNDPPINFISGSVDDGKVNIGHALSLPVPETMSGLSPGNYTFGIRASQLNLKCEADGCAHLQGRIGLAEINGSETFVHFKYGDDSPVVQENGVHAFEVGNQVSVYVRPEAFYVFNATGDLVVAPANQ